MNNERWLLPEGIAELLPAQAARLEGLQRNLLDMYQSWGYELVIPPFIEYLESLLTGTGNDLDLQTFKLTDQLTGRMMGVRADMTPQVARIDAHILKRDVPTRLCYMGTVLHTRPKNHGGSRCPFQAGVELYGHAGIESDLEVLRLMIATLQAAGLEQVHLDLGHVGIFRGLARQAGLDAYSEAQLFEALQRKAVPDIEELVSNLRLEDGVTDMLLALAQLNGDASILETATEVLAEADSSVHLALKQLWQMAESISAIDGVSLHLDLAELRGYHYHTGMVFAAFVTGQGQAIAQGGRYDDIGEVFGRARPATGFSTDLRALLNLVPAAPAATRGIFAPGVVDPLLDDMIARLRSGGERVVRELPGQHGDAAAMGCDRVLVQNNGQWEVTEL
jgi:ATP phosphoribosyltransferase regulatory subunit